MAELSDFFPSESVVKDDGKKPVKVVDLGDSDSLEKAFAGMLSGGNRASAVSTISKLFTPDVKADNLSMISSIPNVGKVVKCIAHAKFLDDFDLDGSYERFVVDEFLKACVGKSGDNNRADAVLKVLGKLYDDEMQLKRFSKLEKANGEHKK